MRNLGLLLLIGLVIYCAFDIRRSDDDERMGVHRVLWLLIVLFFPLFGCLIWLTVSRARRAAGVDGNGGAAGQNRRPRGPVAPDDDPEFLWRLDQQRRNREQGPPNDAPPTP